MTKKKITRELPVKLNDTQLAIKRDELANAVTDRTQLENDLKNYAAGERKKIKDVKAKAKELAGQILAEVESVEIDCVEEHVFEQNKVIVRRLDTKEIVETRAMTADERQEPLPMDVNGGAKKSTKLRAVKTDESDAAH
jgi:hypothetical protein